MIRKLRKRFIITSMIALTSVLLIMGIAINAVTFISTNNTINDILLLLYDHGGSMPSYPPEKRQAPLSGKRLTAEAPFSTRFFVITYDSDGALVSADMRNIAAVTDEDAQTYLEIARRHGDGFGISGNYKYYVAATDDGNHMAIFLYCHEQFFLLKTFLLISCMVILCADYLAFLVVLALSKRAIAPTVKNMEKQKQFITDASHELKTPLTVINTSLKLLEMETGESKWIDKIQGQTDKLTGLVADLVTLSRLDEDQPPLQRQDFDLSAAALETVESFTDSAVLQGHSLTTDVESGITYHGDEYAIRQLLSILLDNAVKYTDPDGEIHFYLKRVRKGISLGTINPCADTEKEETEKYFERFYRSGNARQQTKGFGIGLSIAKSITEAHNGSIRAEHLPDGTIRFVVTLK